MKHRSASKKGSSEAYSHPLIKSLEETVCEDHTRIIPTYQSIQPSHQNRTSSKLIRSTTLTPTANSQMQIIIQPFHQLTAELPVINSIRQCPVCKCVANPLTVISNYNELRCNLCLQSSEIASYDSEQYKNGFAVRLEGETSFSNIRTSQDKRKTVQQSKQSQTRRVCLAIEVSQYNFEYGVHTSIANCVKALQDEDLQIGFLFFDNKSIMFYDHLRQELVKMSISVGESKENLLDGWEDFPIMREDFFQHISLITEQTRDIFEAVLYQGFLIKETVLLQVTELLFKFMPKQVQIKLFISTLNSLGDVPQDSQNGMLSKIFKERQNILPNVMANAIEKRSFLVQQSHIRSLQLSENMQFFVILQSTTYKQCIDLLKYTIHRIYCVKEKKTLSQILYYDLFDNIGYPLHVNCQISVRTSSELQLQLPSHSSMNLYDNISIVEDKEKDKEWRSYKVIVKQGHHTTAVPLNFKVLEKIDRAPFIQIDYSINTGKNRNRVILNYPLLEILPQNEHGIEWVDDQALFNSHLRKSIAAWDGVSYKHLKDLLQDQYRPLIRLFIENYSHGSINFPKSFKHYFIFTYLWEERINKGLISAYQIYKLMTTNLEVFSKQFYFRTYRIENEQVKNIKCSEIIFVKNSIIFMQNGQQLFMIFSNASVQQIKEVFGHFDSIATLARLHYELPELQSNTLYRQAITSIRSNHHSNFLPLRIIDIESHLFDSFIAPYLYSKDDHFSFLKRIWKTL